MFTVSLLSKGDKFRALGLNAGNYFVPLLRIPAKGASKRLGLEPVDSGVQNSIGDKECLHQNIKGQIFYGAEGVFSKRLFTSIRYRPTSSYDEVDLPVYLLYLYSSVGMCSGTHIIDVGVDFDQSFYTDWYEYYPWVPLRRTRRRCCVRWSGLVFETHVILETYVPSTGQVLYSDTVQRWELNENSEYYRQSSTVVLTTADAKPNWIYYPFGDWQRFGYYASGTIESEQLDFPKSLTAFNIWTRFIGVMGDQLYSQNSFIWGDLAQDAANNTRRLDINTPAYIADFFKVKDLVKSFAGLATGKLTAKKLSSAFLAFQYGIKLTYLDTKEISKALQRTLIMVDDLPFQVARSRASETFKVTRGVGAVPLFGERQLNFKLYYNPLDNDFVESVRSMMSWDLFPTLSNVWDYIPFSFVVDWFVKVQDHLERIDHNTYISTLRVLSCIMTTRTSLTVPAGILLGAIPGGMVTGDLTLIYYDRKVEPVAPSPISRFDLPRSFNHWIEGAALLIQGH